MDYIYAMISVPFRGLILKIRHFNSGRDNFMKNFLMTNHNERLFFIDDCKQAKVLFHYH